jgi:two-component system chemotaxis response regulator CheY
MIRIFRSPRAPEDNVSGMASATGQGSRVLVVEDDPDIRGALCECLGLEGFEVLSARDGEEALARLTEEPLPHAIVLDMVMPVLDGPATLERLRSNESWSRIPVVLASADPAASRTAERHVSKPYRVSELVAVLGEIVSSADR